MIYLALEWFQESVLDRVPFLRSAHTHHAADEALQGGELEPAPARYDFLLSRRRDDTGYGLWRVDIDGDDLLRPVPLDPKASFDPTHQIIPIGRYLLEWGTLTLPAYEPCFPYRLFEFDPTAKDPLAGEAVRNALSS